MSAPTPARAERINPRAAQAVDALLSGQAQTQKAAAKLAGINEEHLCRLLKRPHYVRFIQERSAQFLKGLPALRAAATLAKLSAAKSEDVAARVSQRIVEHAGIMTPHAGATIGAASPVPLLSIVFKHSDSGSSVAVGVQLEGQAQEVRDISTPSIPAPVPAKEGDTGGQP